MLRSAASVAAMACVIAVSVSPIKLFTCPMLSLLNASRPAVGWQHGKIRVATELVLAAHRDRREPEVVAEPEQGPPLWLRSISTRDRDAL